MTENCWPTLREVRSPENDPLNGMETVEPASTETGGRPGAVPIVTRIGEPLIEARVAPSSRTLIPNEWVFVTSIVPTIVPFGPGRSTTCQTRGRIGGPGAR